MIDVREGNAADIARVNTFYAAHGRSARIGVYEQVVLAEEDGCVIRAVRLCTEHGYLILRTMRVSDAYQRQGVGQRMLHVLNTLLQGRECYGLPFDHLMAFYGGIGFTAIPVEDAPPHLQKRYHAYSSKGDRVLVMKRPAAYCMGDTQLG